MNRKKIRLGVVPIGRIREIVPKTVSAHLLGYFNLEADVLPPLEQPDHAFDGRRLQYDAGVILRGMDAKPFQDYAKVLGILDVDLFVPILTHVFGEAQQGGKHALVSLYRLKGQEDGASASMPLLLERTAKVALHETGHLFNLLHCRDSRCLMHFSGGLPDLDGTPILFCKYCSAFLRDALRRFASDHF